MPQKTAKTRAEPSTTQRKDDFASVARRLECDQDMEAFDAKLKNIARATRPPDTSHGPGKAASAREQVRRRPTLQRPRKDQPSE